MKRLRGWNVVTVHYLGILNESRTNPPPAAREPPFDKGAFWAVRCRIDFFHVGKRRIDTIQRGRKKVSNATARGLPKGSPDEGELA